jgi:hypothetical protein
MAGRFAWSWSTGRPSPLMELASSPAMASGHHCYRFTIGDALPGSAERGARGR